MPNIKIQGKDYEVPQVRYTELMALGKYLNACLPTNNQACLTPDLDKATGYALRKIIPTIDPMLANEETGVNMDFFTEFYPLFVDLKKIYDDSDNTVEVKVEETKEMKVARLQKELAQVTEGE